MDTAIPPPSVFISYSRKDGRWLDELTTLLAPVVRAGIASVWWDKKIKPSQHWRQEIDTALASARLSILLVSPHFLASDFIQDEELPFLIDAAQRRGVRLLWVLVSPCLYEHSPLRDIQAAHDLSKPLSTLRRETRQTVLAGIGRAVVEALGPAAPVPRYEDDRTREIGEQLATARRRLKELTIAGQDVTDVREQILGLKRSRKDGERLKPGDWLGDDRFQLLEVVGRGGFATVWQPRPRRHRGIAVRW